MGGKAINKGKFFYNRDRISRVWEGMLSCLAAVAGSADGKSLESSIQRERCSDVVRELTKLLETLDKLKSKLCLRRLLRKTGQLRLLTSWIIPPRLDEEHCIEKRRSIIYQLKNTFFGDRYAQRKGFIAVCRQ